MRRIGAALGAIALLGTGGCQDGREPFARASEIRAVDEAIGGPTANARVGDYLLYNDQIRAVIEQGITSMHPADVGGTLIDMDLNRPEQEYRGGNGLDQMGQLVPIANLSAAQALAKPNVRITGSAAGAEVTAAAEAAPVFRILLALTLLLDQRFVDGVPEFRMYTEYELRPGERMVRMTTTVGFNVPFCRVKEEDGCNPECDDALYDDDCECPSVPARCTAGVAVRPARPLPEGDRPVSSILDVVLGDLPRPLGTGVCTSDSDCDATAGERCVDVTSNAGGEYRVCRSPAQRDGGVFFGDLLIFGGNLRPFVRGIGYDTQTDVRRLFDQGEDTLAKPLDIDGVVATGDRVSYGYASPSGRVLVPIFEGPFSLGATHAASCPSDQPGCLNDTLVRLERWVSVGTGDVASAQEPIARALGQPLGTVAGQVTELPAGTPMSDIAVYALRDPRWLECDQTCQQACPLPAGAPAAWTLEQLIAANRCRSRDQLFAEGTAQIQTFALTDPGTDPVRDGDFRMALAPGQYILVAVDGARARSALRPVTVDEGAVARAALALPEPGRLHYAIFDETGRPIPGKLVIGESLPGSPCTSDAQCPSGELCQAGACAQPWRSLLPLEMGGRRPQDGVMVLSETATGTGEVALPPGQYEILIARGPHYSIDRQTVTIEPRVSTQVRGTIRRVVDKRGWISADFHVHATNSMDSGTPLEERVVGFAAEDMDFLSSSDHDWLTRYEYLIEEMGLSDMLGSQIGAEITTQEYGHYIAFPLRHLGFQDGERVTSNGAVQWRGLTPGGIMREARQLALGDVPVVIDIPHPFDYFELYLLDPLTLEPADSLLSLINPFLDPGVFSGDFDAMELVNSKAYSRFRRPTVGEVRGYSVELDRLIAELRAGAIDAHTYDRRIYALSMDNIRARAHRTPAEQDAFWTGQGLEVACYCGSHGDCAAGLVCDDATMLCVEPPVDDSPPPPPDWMCRRYRGIMDDWFNMLNRGVVRTGLSGSDVHSGETGSMRTFLRLGGTTPPYVTEADIVDAVLGARAVVSNGPMVHFTIDDVEVGDMLQVPRGRPLRLSIRVEKAGWYDVDLLEVYRNGDLIHWVRGCASERGQADAHDHGCLDTSDGAVVAWAGEMVDTPTEDAWYVVMVYGLDGRSLAPVYGSVVLPGLGVPELTQRIYDLIPRLREFRNPRYPSLHPTFPFAFTNPIWIDVDSDGWNPLLPPPSWCRPGDFGC